MVSSEPLLVGRTIEQPSPLEKAVVLPHRHCEPTGRARARPMTGSAKQSISPRKGRMDCFVAEFIIGPAEGRTRWLLAMTALVVPFNRIGPPHQKPPLDHAHGEVNQDDKGGQH